MKKLDDIFSSTYGSYEFTHLAYVLKIAEHFSQTKMVFHLLLVSQLALTYANGQVGNIPNAVPKAGLVAVVVTYGAVCKDNWRKSQIPLV